MNKPEETMDIIMAARDIESIADNLQEWAYAYNFGISPDVYLLGQELTKIAGELRRTYTQSNPIG